MVTVIFEDVGEGQTYETLSAWKTAFDAYNFVSNDEFHWARLHAYSDGSPHVIAAGTTLTFDNTNTDATRGRGITVATGDEFKPWLGTGVWIEKTFDHTIAGVEQGIHVDREVGFQIKGPIGIFLRAAAKQTNGSAVFIGIECDAPSPFLQQIYLEYLHAGHGFGLHLSGPSFRNQLTGIGIGNGATTEIDDARVHNCILVANLFSTSGEGIGDLLSVDTNVGSWSIQGITAVGNLSPLQRCINYPNEIPTGGASQDNKLYMCYGARAGLEAFNNNPTSSLESDKIDSGGFLSADTNLSDDESAQWFAALPALPQKAQPSIEECFINWRARDFRLRFGSPLKKGAKAPNFPSAPDTSLFSLTDYLGNAHTGPTWVIGALETTLVPTYSLPTETVGQVGYAKKYEHPWQWERSTRGNLVGTNTVEKCLVEEWPGEPYTLDNDQDDPEDLSQWAVGSDMATGFPVSSEADAVRPWGFGRMWQLKNKTSTAAHALVSHTAGNMAGDGSYNCIVVVVDEETSPSFRVNIRNTTDAVSHPIDFDWVAGVPTQVGTPGARLTYYVRALGTTGQFSVQVNYQSDSSDVGDARSIFLYCNRPGETDPLDGLAQNFGFVRCVTRTADVEIGYVRGGEGVFMDDPVTLTDRSRFRLIEPASGNRHDPAKGSGVHIRSNGLLDVFRVTHPFSGIVGAKLEQAYGTGSEARCAFVAADGARLDGCDCQLKVGTGADRKCVLVQDPCDGALIVNNYVHGVATGDGATRGIHCTGDGAEVDNNTVLRITQGTAIGMECTTGKTSWARNNVVGVCDTEMSWDEERQQANATEDATALGVGSITGLTLADEFQDHENDDVRLLETSQLLDAGVHLGALFGFDIAGRQRIAPWEIGCYDGFAFAPLRKAVGLRHSNRLVRLYDLFRDDGAGFHKTDHNAPFNYEGRTYTPSKGASISAVRSELALRESGADVSGVISDDEITDADLHAGLYRNAKIRVRIVDPRFPFAEPIGPVRVWTILNTKWTSEGWLASIVGAAHILNARRGERTSKTCRADLGDARCGVNVVPLSYYNVDVDSVVDARRSFALDSAAVPASLGDDYFTWGIVQFVTGNLAGQRYVIKDYDETGSPDRLVTTQLRLPRDVQVGDKVNVIVGDDKRFSTCVGKFANGLRFVGEPHIPGTDKALSTPSN